MSSMVLTKLLNPDPGADPALPGRAAASDRGRTESGPSRYDEVVRQQERRLEQRRAEERTLEHQRREEVASDGRPDRADQSASAGDTDRADRRDLSRHGHRPAGSGEAEGRAQGEPDRTEAASDPTETPGTGLAGLIELEVDGPGAGVMQGPAADARSAAQVAAALAAPGNQPGMPSTAGALFAAMLETGKETSGRGSDLLAGLTNGSSQLLSDSSGKFGDTLASQLTARLSAPELSQPLNQAATLRGQEANALMRSYSTSVDSPVGADEWGDKVMGKMAWLTASQMSVAEIHITPPELGPIDVRVQVQNDQATVTVHAATPAVREQLELHGHRLRDMLSEQGLTLEGFDVSDSSGRESPDQGDGDDPGAEPATAALAGEGSEGDAGPVTSGALDLSWRGEVDLYA